MTSYSIISKKYFFDIITLGLYFKRKSIVLSHKGWFSQAADLQYLRFSRRIGSQIFADNVHIKISLTIASLPAKLNSAQLHRQACGQCLGQILLAIK